MNTVSFWKAITKKTKHHPELSQDTDVDVVVIGGGITGVTAALELTNAGKKVAIIEADEIGGVTTGYSSGNLYIAVQPYYQHIVSKFNLETAKKIAESRNHAIDYIEKNIKEKNISCNYSRRPWYLYTEDESKITFLDKEVETFKQMDIPIKFTESLPLPLKFKKAAVIENQARFNPLQYVVTLGEHLAEKGCLIFENSRVVSHTEQDDKCIISTDKAKVTAKHCIIATHTPIGINTVQLFTAPYRSYVVSVSLKDKIYPEGHFWDLNYPHHAICTHSISNDHPELLMVAGNHHKVGQEPNTLSHYAELENFLRQHFSVDEVLYRWSAQHYHAADDVPYIGFASRGAKNTYIAAGFFADGLVYGTLAARIISDVIIKKDNPLSDTYNANRFTPVASAAFLMKENSNVFWQYLKDYTLPKPKEYDDIKAGEGKVVVINNEKCGVYRDDNNQLHVVSAVCTHMKCIVRFNNAEKTWDCPCHGSRFTTEGKVIEGPAELDLKEIEKK